MKTLSQQLKRAANALAFANAGNLHALTTMLETPKSKESEIEACPARDEEISRAGHAPTASSASHLQPNF
ncbi:MAG: hypothetical protein PHQ60_07750 [Sideroxydans sp.]|nr:hypothetical protein [Sideroxydans sp.]